MSYHALAGLAGGAAGVVAMTTMMRAAVDSGMTQLRMPLLLGGMVTGDRDRATRIGVVVHLVNGLIFGLAYAAVWWGFGVGSEALLTGIWVGAAIGAMQSVLVALVMPMLGRMHPRAVDPYPASTLVAGRERSAVGGRGGAGAAGSALPAPAVAEGPAPVTRQVRLPRRFGFGGTAFGPATPIGLLAAHLVFGAAWGVVFAAVL